MTPLHVLTETRAERREPRDEADSVIEGPNLIAVNCRVLLPETIENKSSSYNVNSIKFMQRRTINIKFYVFLMFGLRAVDQTIHLFMHLYQGIDPEFFQTYTLLGIYEIRKLFKSCKKNVSQRLTLALLNFKTNLKIDQRHIRNNEMSPTTGIFVQLKKKSI